MGERVTTENAVGLLAVMDRRGSGRTNHADALRDLLDARDDLDAARATFGELFDCAGTERVSDLMRMAVQECRSEQARFKARGEEMDRVEQDLRDLARWKIVAALLLEACDYTTEDIRANSDGAREQAEAIAAGVRERFAALERERDQARTMLGECYRLSGADTDGNDWPHLWPHAVAEVRRARADLDEAQEEAAKLGRERDEAREIAGCLRWERQPAQRWENWRLLAGNEGIGSIRDAGGCWRGDFGGADIRDVGTRNEAARAVCDALGLPFITAGLPDEVTRG